MKDFIEDISNVYMLIKEKAIFKFVKFKKKEELKEKGKWIIYNRFYNQLNEWNTIESFMFNGEVVFHIQQRFINNNIEFRAIINE